MGACPGVAAVGPDRRPGPQIAHMGAWWRALARTAGGPADIRRDLGSDAPEFGGVGSKIYVWESQTRRRRLALKTEAPPNGNPQAAAHRPAGPAPPRRN